MEGRCPKDNLAHKFVQAFGIAAADVFDPADFLGNARQKADVKRWRESEITHGRVAMLAALGFIVQEQIIDFPNLPFPHVEGRLRPY